MRSLILFTSLAFYDLHFYVEIQFALPNNFNSSTNPEMIKKKENKRTSGALYIIVKSIHTTLQKVPNWNV